MSQGDQNINVLPNDGTGHFGAIITTSFHAFGLTPRAIIAADFLGNGTTQLVMATDNTPPDVYDNYYGGEGLVLLRPNGNGTFQVPTTSPSFIPEDPFPDHYYSENVAPDLNGDGKPDFVFGHSTGANLVTVGLNQGNGSFAVSHYVASAGPGPTTPPGPYNSKETTSAGIVVAGDFHGTGIPDIAVGVFNDNNRAGGLSLLPAVPSAPGTYLSPRAFVTGAAGDTPNGGLGTSGHAQLLGNFGPNNSQALLTLGAHTIHLATVNANGTVGGFGTIFGDTNQGIRGDLTAADFNSDGRPDFAFINNGVVETAINNGNGTFTVSSSVASTATGHTVANYAIGDFNGDGKPDIALLSSTFGFQANNQVDVYLNIGSGGFRHSATMALGTLPGYYAFGIAAGDFNGNGKVDLAADYAATVSNTDIALFSGNGDGTFAAPAVIASPNNNGEPTELVTADLRHDGRLDLIGNGYGSLQVYLSNGNGTFQPGTVYTAGEAFDLQITDIDGDGKLDIVTASQSGLFVLTGNGDGTLNAAQQFAVGQGSLFSVNVADLNGDGHPDIVTERSATSGAATTVLLASVQVAGTQTTISTQVSSVIPGRAQTFSVIVTPDPTIGGLPTGPVTFHDGSTTLGTANLVNVGGVARATFSVVLGLGSHSISASYGGDPADRASSSPAIPAYVGDNLKNDFDGDGKADLAVFGKDPVTGKFRFLIVDSSTGFNPSKAVTFTNNGYGFGNAQSIPVPADYFGDGRSAYALWTPNNVGGMTFTAVSAVNGKSVTVNFGGTRDVPVVADVDGDGKADFGVYGYDPKYGYRFDFLLSSTGFNVNQQELFNNNGYGYGNARSIPVVADFNGNGHADFGLFTPSSSGSSFTEYDPITRVSLTRAIGAATDTPMTVDTDGDGKADLVLYGPDPAKAGHYRYEILTSSSGFNAAQAVTFDNNGYGYGNAASVPVVADYEGTGKADFGLFTPDNKGGMEYVYQTGQTGPGVVLDFATSTDLALTAPLSAIAKKVRGS